jgi:TetR/AcrR family transcriptional regulator, transcriptional repressor for nem operon
MDIREKILMSAQRLVQQRGFNGFSYADIAKEVGIRKPSLHHHFPTKAELGVALIDEYTANLSAGLGQIREQNLSADAKLAAYMAIYRATLEADRMCMGGMLVSDALTLDAAMLPGIKRFFARNIEWLTEILTEGKAQQCLEFAGSPDEQARLLVSALQGALMIARGTKDSSTFEQTVTVLMAALTKRK